MTVEKILIPKKSCNSICERPEQNNLNPKKLAVDNASAGYKPPHNKINTVII